MVGNFKHKGLKRFFDEDDARKLPADMKEKIRVILTALDAAQSANDLNGQEFKRHGLKGDRKGDWSITVRANWRITFRFDEGVASNVNLEDYHKK